MEKETEQSIQDRSSRVAHLKGRLTKFSGIISFKASSHWPDLKDYLESIKKADRVNVTVALSSPGFNKDNLVQAKISEALAQRMEAVVDSIENADKYSGDISAMIQELEQENQKAKEEAQ